MASHHDLNHILAFMKGSLGRSNNDKGSETYRQPAKPDKPHGGCSAIIEVPETRFTGM